MVAMKISDGLGNQMFQYAAGRSIVLKRGEVLKLDLSAFNKNYELRSYLLTKFNVTYSKFTLLEKFFFSRFYRFFFSRFLFAAYKEKDIYKYDKKVFCLKYSYFIGYWQNSTYFKDIKLKLLKEFTLKKCLDNTNKYMLENIKTSNSVSIHIRRGDFLDIEGQDICTLEYYHNAIKYISNILAEPIFFIFSDDIEWAKQNLCIDNSVEYIDFNAGNPECDLELMKNCKHNIIANSTFSWWGAWLNINDEKIVIGPKEWKKGLPVPAGLMMKNMVLL